MSSSGHRPLPLFQRIRAPQERLTTAAVTTDVTSAPTAAPTTTERPTPRPQMSPEGYTITKIERVDGKVHLLYLTEQIPHQETIYADSYPITREGALEFRKKYSLKITQLFNELSPIFGLVKMSIYSDGKFLHFVIPTDPQTLRPRNDERLRPGELQDPEQLAILKKTLMLRWALGMPCRGADLRWRTFPEGAALISSNAHAGMRETGGSLFGKRLNELVDEMGLLLCQLFNLTTLQAASDWRYASLDKAKEAVMKIDSEISYVATGAINLLYNRIYSHIAHSLAEHSNPEDRYQTKKWY